MDDFCAKIAEILETEMVRPETEFRQVDDFDSLKGFAIIVTIERDYGRRLSVDEFLSCSTIADLGHLAGVN